MIGEYNFIPNGAFLYFPSGKPTTMKMTRSKRPEKTKSNESSSVEPLNTTLKKNKILTHLECTLREHP